MSDKTTTSGEYMGDEADRERLYEEVRKTADRLNLAMGAANLGDWSWDIASDLMTMSERAAEIFGVPAGTHLTRARMRDLLHPDDRDGARAAAEKAVQTGVAYENEYRVNLPDGTQRWVAARGAGIFDAAGKMTGMLGVVQDISRRKLDEARVAELTRTIHEQSRVFDITLSNIFDFAYTFNREGRFIYANKPLLDLLGRALDEVVGKNFHDLQYPTELANRLQRQIEEVFATGKPVRDETPYTGAEGGEGFYEYIFSPVYDPAGNISIVAGSTRDITEHRRAEGARRQLAAIVESSDDAIVSKTLDGVIVSWNAGAERLFGYSPDEAIGQSVTMLIPIERHDEEPEIVGRIRLGEPVQHYETIRLRKDGSAVAVSLSVSSIRDREGRIIGASKIARDITKQKQTELALKEAKEAAEAANRSKDHFLAVLSHELRTPLNPVLMTASALEMDPKLSPELRTDMAMIRRNVELETKLIDDLLDLSRITSGKLALHVRSIDLNEAVRQVGAICEQQIFEKGIRLHMDLDAEAGHVRADPARLQQVLWNILKNAAKFTPEGGSISMGTSRSPGGDVRITIRDTGIGIDVEVLPRIFDAFEQGDARITRQFGGLGLGLAISKALVMLHEGTIRGESEGAGKGTSFIIELPVAVESGPQALSGTDKPRACAALRILIVEDHVDTADMLSRLLGASGYDVAVANSAGAGLEIYRRMPFDIVVSDIGLPDATGYDFMRSLREIREIKGIAMSGYGMEEDIRKSLEAGFNEHLVKPVNLLSLEQAIRRLASTMRTKETPG